MPVLHVQHLDANDLALAYPLVRSAVRIELAQWHDFAGALLEGDGGIVVVRGDAGCLYGLATYRPVFTVRHRRSLWVELVVAVELGGRQAVREALIGRLTHTAQSRACKNVIFTISASTRNDWERHGCVDETLTLVRSVDSGNCSS